MKGPFRVQERSRVSVVVLGNCNSIALCGTGKRLREDEEGKSGAGEEESWFCAQVIVKYA